MRQARTSSIGGIEENAMSDDKSNVGKADRDRVSAEERYEVDTLVKKYGLPRETIIEDGLR